MLTKKKLLSNINLNKNSNVITLIGMMGAGKTKFGSSIAKKNNYKFYDSDYLVEKRFGQPVKDIFMMHGEVSFRKVEQEEIQNIIVKSQTINNKVVISLGGGAFDHLNTRNLLLKNSKVIWLNTPINILIRRIYDKSKRPMIKGDIKESLEALLKKRLPHYMLCHYKLDTEKLSVQKIEDLITYISLN